MTTKRIAYKITPKNPSAHLFEVTCYIPKPDINGQKLFLPVWIPGSYMIREFSRNIVWLKAFTGDALVDVQKIDKATWQCAPSNEPLAITYEVYAWDLSVRAAHLDQTHGFFNGPSVFLMVLGQEDQPVDVEIVRPQGSEFDTWKVATAMTRKSAQAFGFGLYEASNYDELIDHPVEMGNFTLAHFTACGVPHDIAITGKHRANLERLTADLKTICEYQIRLFGEPAPMDHYVFLIMAVGDGYGGLEHRASTALICSRDDLPLKNEGERNDKYRTFLGLASHEYFHTWNIKRIKPEAFMLYDLTKENYTRQLWAFEGFTSYYDDLVLVRTGLVSEEEYLTTLGETITRVLRGSGRLKQSVADSSFDAWIKYYRQDENSTNSIVNYYAKGALIGLALDLKIRAVTDNQKSLDDVMKTLWHQYGQKKIGVPEGQIEKIVEEIAGTELSTFIAKAIYDTEDLPLKDLLASVGIELMMRSSENTSDNGGKPSKNGSNPRAILGAKISNDGKITSVYDSGAAQLAGLSAGDNIIAIDCLKVSGRDIDTRLKTYDINTEIKVHAFRRDELIEFNVNLLAAEKDTCYLKIIEKEEDTSIQLRKKWLAGS